MSPFWSLNPLMAFVFWMHFVVIIIPLFLSFHQVISHIVVIPIDTEVLLNQSTHLNCTTDQPSQEVSWYHYRAGNPYRRLNVYDGGMVERSYRQRFRIDGDRGSGEFNLVIESVQGQDAGKFECQDGGGVGDKRSANVVVLEDELRCSSDAKESGVVGPNDCGLRSDAVQLSCSVRFQGEVAPRLRWRVRDGDSSDLSNDSLCWTSANERVCNITISVDRIQLSSASFVCETSRMIGRRQSNCTADQLKIMYAFGGVRKQVRSIREEMNCSANSSQPCLYSWSQVKDGEVVNVSENAVFVPQVVGWYRCLARCSFAGRVCTVEPLNVIVFSSDEQSSECDCGQRTPSFVPWLVAFGSAVAVAAVAVAFGVLIAVKKRRRKDALRIGRSADEAERQQLQQQSEQGGQNFKNCHLTNCLSVANHQKSNQFITNYRAVCFIKEILRKSFLYIKGIIIIITINCGLIARWCIMPSLHYVAILFPVHCSVTQIL